MSHNKNDLVNGDLELPSKVVYNEEDETLPMDYSTKTRKVNDAKFKILLDRKKKDTNGKETGDALEATTNTTSNDDVSIVGCTAPPINRVIRKVESFNSIFINLFFNYLIFKDKHLTIKTISLIENEQDSKKDSQ